MQRQSCFLHAALLQLPAAIWPVTCGIVTKLPHRRQRHFFNFDSCQSSNITFKLSVAPPTVRVPCAPHPRCRRRVRFYPRSSFRQWFNTNIQLQLHCSTPGFQHCFDLVKALVRSQRRHNLSGSAAAKCPLPLRQFSGSGIHFVQLVLGCGSGNTATLRQCCSGTFFSVKHWDMRFVRIITRKHPISILCFSTQNTDDIADTPNKCRTLRFLFLKSRMNDWNQP
ncbi:hypothetical protein C8R46DRAFT_1079978 [Mycena filopes]|nr:hypothetical protein C8R46DRAFT_1079978 [Mycena filopes]